MEERTLAVAVGFLVFGVVLLLWEKGEVRTRRGEEGERDAPDKREREYFFLKFHSKLQVTTLSTSHRIVQAS